jgi:hypothetical protein
VGTALYHPPGSLAVSGANEDSERIAQLILNHTEMLDEIYVTLDSHHVRSIPCIYIHFDDDVVVHEWLGGRGRSHVIALL